ncbi:hypothetical protein C8034_v011367 [Colletotrichum sidae]|uniref:DUF1868 domain-containing protein n=1 Tax=Colletotrichum sidae TaxID=1347389 RepID=A0A4R8TI42_9PEZI|nr:hypothetical protein C8034_v011367 [Colletotrichum sidae]
MLPSHQKVFLHTQLAYPASSPQMAASSPFQETPSYATSLHQNLYTHRCSLSAKSWPPASSHPYCRCCPHRASFHMTVFEGVCDQVRQPGYWPSDLASNAPLETCNTHFEKTLSSFKLTPDETPPYKRRFFLESSSS